ncbi:MULTISPECIES: lipase family protein [Nocardia]|uniref:lipase family protein n=1 Tax=Nocardia TaxID=1817 RepID=UPI0006F6A860|nr:MULTISPECIES: lipase family protein [Nocardia]KQY31968.1 lipase [Nocardia sp. Root136]
MRPESWPAPTKAVLPDKDPFFAPRPGFESLAEGTILRSRPVELAAFGLIGLKVEAWQLLYRTTDLNGVPEASVTTVVAPVGGVAPGAPLLSFQCAIDAISPRAFPSYSLQRGSRAIGTFAHVELLCFVDALSKGWAISIPDHEGMLGAWGAPREPGYRALDGIRAALAFEPGGLDPSAQVGLWGYSGGGLATAWAAEMAPTYAPELDIVGAVLGSPVGDLVSTFHRLNGGLHAGLPTLVVAALRRVYPAFEELVTTHFSDEGRAVLDKAAQSTTAAAVMRLARYNVDRHSGTPIAELLAMEAMLAVFADLTLGDRAPAVPLLVVQAVHDQIISVADIDALVQRYREHGAHVTYLRDRASEHLTLLPLSTPLSLNWLNDRFAGVAVTPSQTRTVRSVLALPAGRRGLGALALAALRVLFGRPITASTAGYGTERTASRAHRAA